MTTPKADLTFGKLTTVGNLTFGDLAFGEMTFGDLIFGKPTGHRVSRFSTTIRLRIISVKVDKQVE